MLSLLRSLFLVLLNLLSLSLNCGYVSLPAFKTTFNYDSAIIKGRNTQLSLLKGDTDAILGGNDHVKGNTKCGYGCMCCNNRKSLRRGLRNTNSRLYAGTFIKTAYDAVSSAFIGGTVGVMGTMITLELKKGTTDANLDQCPYCIGNGRLLCAGCLGTGSKGNCKTCNGLGLVECIGCKGDGRNVPLSLISKGQRDPDYNADEISLDKP